MLFNSIHFFIFAPLVIFIFFIIPKRYQNYWLFLMSLYFYAVFKFLYVFLLLYSIVISYLSIYFIFRFYNKQNLKKIFMILGIMGNLALLIIFKYLVQFYDILNFFLGFSPCDKEFIEPPNILLPMGISFFSLQAISAIVDSYYGTIEKPKHILYFGLYLSFFPQLVAGPILRTKDLLDQFYFHKKFDFTNFRYGFFYIVSGFYKKTLIADQISNSVDQVFNAPWEYHSLSLWLSVFLFSIQIYCDFSGYSDIAIGTARILGYTLPENFRRPFFSVTMGEFWRRWHISLSSWFRDYVYVPLGGSKVSSIRTYINVFITMFISGIWHGAGWNYVLWGSIHGVFLLLEKFLLSFKIIKQIKLPKWFGITYTFWVFSFTFFFFRAKPLQFPETNFVVSSIDVAKYMVARAFMISAGKMLNVDSTFLFLTFILFIFEFFLEKKEKTIENIIKSPLLFVFGFVILFLCVVLYSITVNQPFVYFQF